MQRSSRRTAAHCIEYVHLVLWEKRRGGEEFDADNAEHMEWMYREAAARADVYGIQVGTLSPMMVWGVR